MSTPCILWTKATQSDGYGRVRREGKLWRAHRWAAHCHHGPCPDGQVVRHTCDNPTCVNPEHLIYGTQLDNMRDMKERGRLGKRRGAGHHSAVLSDAQIAEIRGRYTGARGEVTALAKEFGVSVTSVSDYVRGVYR